MSNSLSLLKKVFKVPFSIRVFLAVLASNFLLQKLRSKSFAQLLSKVKTTRSTGPSIVPLADGSSHWLANLVLGHFADIKPWDCEVGFIAGVMAQRHQWYKSVAEKFGTKSARVHMVHTQFVFTHDLDLINSFHGKEDRLLRNSDTIRGSIKPLFPDSIVVLTGDQWKRVRRVFASAVNKLDFEVLPPITNSVLQTGIDSYVENDCQEIFLRDFFAKVVFDSFHQFTFGKNFGTISGQNLDLLDNLKTIADGISNRMIVSMPVIWKLPLKSNRDMWKAKEKFVEFCQKFVDERTAVLTSCEADETIEDRKKKFTNLLDAFIWAGQEVGKKSKKYLTKQELTSQIFAAMIGAFDTTSSTMALTTINLMRNPDCQERLYQEIKDIDLSKATQSQLDALEYLPAVIDETLRFNTPSPATVRTPNQDVVVNGTLFKEGTNIICDHEKLGTIPEFWNGQTDLDKYRPSRWLEMTPTEGAYIPFGFGGRVCIGQKIAKTQLMTMVSFLVQRYKILPSNKPVKIASSLGRSVSKDTTVLFQKRD